MNTFKPPLSFKKELLALMAQGEKKAFGVFNATDGFFAHPEAFKTKKQAEEFILRFPLRYAAQGYYRTANREMISPNDVKLEIIAL